MNHRRNALAAIAGLLLGLALGLGLIPSTVDARDALPPHSCGSPWFPALDDVSPQLVPACAGQTAPRANLATGLLVVAMLSGIGSMLLVRPVSVSQSPWPS